MPKFDVKKLIKFRNTYKKYTKVKAEIGSITIAQEAATQNMSVAEYITFKANELLENEKEISKQMLNNKIAAQTSEGEIKDNSLIQIADNDEEQLNRAAEAVGLCYAMEAALPSTSFKEKNEAAYNEMVANVKKVFHISDEQFDAFKQIIHNVSLETDTYKDYALDVYGSFSSQIDKSSIETTAQKNARINAEKILKGKISFESELVQQEEIAAENRIVDDFKEKLHYGFTVDPQVICDADLFYKQAMLEPRENKVNPNEDGTYDKDCYLRYFDDQIQHLQNKGNKDIDNAAKNMARFIKGNIKGEVVGNDLTFKASMGTAINDAKGTIVYNNNNMFSAKLGKYFVAKQFWQNKGILDIIAHPFKAYDQYKEMQSLKADFMREYNINDEEMEKIDKFQKANKLPKEIPNDFKLGDDLKTNDINDLKFRYKDNMQRSKTQRDFEIYMEEEWKKNDLLGNKEYYKKQNEKVYFMSDKSVEKQIEEKTNELQEDFNKKYGTQEKVNNNPEKKVEADKNIGAK